MVLILPLPGCPAVLAGQHGGLGVPVRRLDAVSGKRTGGVARAPVREEAAGTGANAKVQANVQGRGRTGKAARDFSGLLWSYFVIMGGRRCGGGRTTIELLYETVRRRRIPSQEGRMSGRYSP